jgi:hypothetical protein
LAASRQACSRILELAELSGKAENRVYAFMTASTFHQFISFDPGEAIRYMDMALPLCKKLEEVISSLLKLILKNHVSLSYFGVDLPSWLYQCYAISLAAKGQFDKVKETSLR